MNNENVISPEFYQLLKQYAQSDDPFEDPKFDAIAYLNEKFTDFKSLDKLPSLIEKFEKQISELDEEIDNLMCERAKYNDEMKNYMHQLNNDVEKIIELINTIKTNTDINETTVKMICNDIKNLDNARNNITTTISSLTKLIMLITGIEKLETFVKNKQFKEAANAISASNDILDYFKEYKHVTQVNNLYQKKEQLCSILQATILEEFKKSISLAPNNSDYLYDACLAINSIGDDAIKVIKTWLTQYKLTPYEEIFDPKNSSPVEFHDTERRFEWLKRTLRDYNQLYENIFPPSWGFKSQLCQDFCRITKIHINEILMINLDDSQNTKIDVDVLVRVLNNTIDFENQLHTYLVNDYDNLNKNNNIIAKFENDNTIEEIKAKYEIDPANKASKIDPNTEPKYSPFRVKGVISESFEPYMISYVKIEEKKLKDLIDGLKFSDRIEGKLFVSSLHLFNNIKQAMNRCLTFSKSKTFYDLTIKFKDVFKYYIDTILFSKIRFKEIDKIKLIDDDIKIICFVINTSDYFITTINVLVSSLRDKIEDKFKNQIFYDDIVDHVKLCYKSSFEIIMAHLRNNSNENFLNMSKVNWVNLNDYSNFSQFVFLISKTFENTFLLIKDILSDDIYHILNSIPKLITETFFSNFYKLKKIDESGAQKLLMDIYELKSMILKIYSVVNSGKVSQENDFNFLCLNQAMKKEFGKIESRLKCIGSKVAEIGNAYKTLVEDKSKEDLDKLLGIRGVKKSDISDYDKIFL